MPYIENPFPPESPLHAVAETLLARATPPLTPIRPYDPEIARRIGEMRARGAASYNVAAALHLMNDDLDGAHVLVQSHEDDLTANYLHQIVPRREGDWGNTRYWVSRTGNHPFYADLGAATGQTVWDARAMVDRSEKAARGGSAGETEAVAELSWREMQGLLAWCVAQGA